MWMHNIPWMNSLPWPKVGPRGSPNKLLFHSESHGEFVTKRSHSLPLVSQAQRSLPVQPWGGGPEGVAGGGSPGFFTQWVAAAIYCFGAGLLWGGEGDEEAGVQDEGHETAKQMSFPRPRTFVGVSHQKFLKNERDERSVFGDFSRGPKIVFVCVCVCVFRPTTCRE